MLFKVNLGSTIAIVGSSGRALTELLPLLRHQLLQWPEVPELHAFPSAHVCTFVYLLLIRSS